MAWTLGLTAPEAIEWRHGVPTLGDALTAWALGLIAPKVMEWHRHKDQKDKTIGCTSHVSLVTHMCDTSVWECVLTRILRARLCLGMHAVLVVSSICIIIFHAPLFDGIKRGRKCGIYYDRGQGDSCGLSRDLVTNEVRLDLLRPGARRLLQTICDLVTNEVRLMISPNCGAFPLWDCGSGLVILVFDGVQIHSPSREKLHSYAISSEDTEQFFLLVGYK
ncbi:hypothetical protein Sjap_002270 [Stephania japonica]|uniref:Uncharacterized protein n=1 Tax=Stephania japonica TaxID=461633 RepID=A0AAP0KMH7_9MAGN